MKFAGTIKSLLLVAVAALSACGGGGGGGDTTFGPPGVTLTASTTALSVNTRSAVAITVRMTQSNGTPVANGTVINGVVNSVGLGNLSAVGSGANGLTAQAPTAGGAVTFLFQSAGAAAAGNITFSGQDPLTPGRTLSVIVNVTVSAGAGSDPRISFQPEKTQININPRDVPFFVGSPYISEVLINVRSASGQPLNDTNSGPQTVQLSIDPAELGSVSPLDDPATPDVDERSTRFASIFSGPTSGTVRAFVWSKAQPGTVNLRASFTDPDTGQRVEGVQPIQIVSAVPPGAASVTISPPQSPVYVRDSGGSTFGQLSVSVLDGNDAPIPNPSSGNGAFNNVKIDLLPGSGQGDAVLAATNAAGQSVQGANVSTRTTDGLATISVRAGTRVGTYTVRATTDRADNNVDNGITDPIFGDRAVVISDGRLFSIAITQPANGACVNNSRDPNGLVTTPIPAPEIACFDSSTVVANGLPNTSDGTYSVTVAIIATDRLGNPVIPGTTIKFGLVDYPQDFEPDGGFDLSGVLGNPYERATTFDAADGRFTGPQGGAGGGAGAGPRVQIGDALLVFGHEVEGNRDHESARIVTSIVSATRLMVDRRFNANDDTGQIVDTHSYTPPVDLPYVIGRATRGNIVAQAQTNEFGVARTTMTYPVSHLGLPVMVWAQGEGDYGHANAPDGQPPETVADVDPLVFAGIGPLSLIASPNSIPANGTSAVEVCAFDALGSSIQGLFVRFGFNGLAGTGSVDGNGSAGVVDRPTDESGCTTASVTTSGVLSGSTPTVVFSAGGASAEVSITTATLVLQARPTALTSSGQVTLTLLNGQGQPQAGFLIVGECSGGGGATISLENGPGVTDANGITTVGIVATNLDGVGTAGSGTCTFRTVDGAATATVTLRGVDLCATQFSPRPPGCPTTGGGTSQFSLTLALSGGLGSVSSTPSGLSITNCQRLVTGAANSCSASFNSGATVTLTATPSTAGEVGRFGGECPDSGPNTTTVTMSAARTCSVTFVTP